MAAGDAGTTPAEARAFLARPEAYGPECRQVSVRETHMAWVFLTERHVFKLKKPVRVRNADYRTAAARKAACHAELRLNRRLADWVYLDVVALTRTAAGGLRLGGSGAAVDWLVKMRRLDDARFLDTAIAREACGAGALDRALEHLFAFYRRSRPALDDPASYPDRLSGRVRDYLAELEALAEPADLAPARLRALSARTGERLAAARGALQARGTRVIDAHGDLRPEHVWLGTPPAVIDCLEFDRKRRLLDPLHEVAGLAMECSVLDAGWVGARAMRGYSGALGDPDAGGIAELYGAIAATFRAVASFAHLDDPSVPDKPKYRARGERYLSVAERYLAQAR